MKKTALFLLALLMLGSSSCAPRVEFRGLRFGMDKEQVKTLEQESGANVIEDENAGRLTYSTEMYGIQGKLYYYFAGGECWRVIYHNFQLYASEAKLDATVQEVMDGLIAQYGPPDKEESHSGHYDKLTLHSWSKAGVHTGFAVRRKPLDLYMGTPKKSGPLAASMIFFTYSKKLAKEKRVPAKELEISL